MNRLALVAAAVAALSVAPFAQAPAPHAPAGQTLAAGPDTWQVDTAHSSAGFSVKHMMVSTVRGTLGPITGTIDYDGKSPESITADIAIDVTGIDTDNTNRDNDLKSPNFFDVATHPKATFKSTRVDAAGQAGFRLVGDLTMRGVTKEVTLDVEGPSPILKQPNGTQKVGASATARLNRRDFNLQYNRMIEAAPVVGDEITIQIDIEANKK